jgi:putative salt-induced outer membrane protein
MRTLYVLAFCSLSGAALAQAPAAAPPDPFSGSAALGYLATSGNTEATSLNSSMKIVWDLDGPWKHDFTALAIRATQDDVTTAEAYAAGYKGQRDFSATSYLFFTGDWRQDEFSGYDRQVSETVGYGRRLLDSPRHMLAIEGGDNRYMESTSALKTRVVGNVALVLSYVIKNNSDVPVGIAKTDRFTAISLEYGF